ncbi:MAG: hypothetical protein LBQ88_14600 [Treponema sp.]|jgi:hypothetical protein|nr:hypothetical protein [Treponema sp.]
MKRLYLFCLPVLILAFILFASGCDNGTTDDSPVGYPDPYETSFPYVAQNLNAKLASGNKTPQFWEVIWHLSRSTNAAWTESSPWDGGDNNSQVNLGSFINSEWGTRTGVIWEPVIKYFELPGEGEVGAVYWPKIGMKDALVKYWDDKGLKKVSFDTVREDPTDTDLNDDYYLYYPKEVDVDGATKYPLIVLFHGGGESAVQSETFGFGDIAARDKVFLLAAESNNGPTPASGAASVNGGRIDTALKYVLDNYPIDEFRVYTAGSSMGGGASRFYASTSLDATIVANSDRPVKIAAAAVMDQPFSLYTLGNTGTTATNAIDAIKEYGMPVVYLGGLADMYGMYNVQTAGYFMTHEGASPLVAYINAGWPNYVEGFNKLMEAHGITGKDLSASAASGPPGSAPASQTRFSVANAVANADGTLKDDATAVEEATYWTGYPYDVTEIVTTYGPKVYKSGFTGKDQLLSIVVENRPHMPSGYDAELLWAFMKQWKRDADGKAVKIN